MSTHKENKGQKEEKVNLHKGHRERMRQEFVHDMGESMPDHKLLEMLLFYSIPQRDTNETAHLLLKKFQNVRNLMDADFYQICSVPGVKENSAILIKLIMELYRRYLFNENIVLSSSRMIANYMMPKVLGIEEERLYMLCLTDRLTVHRCIHVSTGNSQSVMIDYKKILSHAVSNKCNQIVLVHNHPCEHVMPSDADIQGTINIVRKLKEVGVEVLDHIIMFDNNYLSMRDSGIIFEANKRNYNET